MLMAYAILASDRVGDVNMSLNHTLHDFATCCQPDTDIGSTRTSPAMVKKPIKVSFTSKANTILVFAVAALLITFCVVTGVVTVPGFRDDGSPTTSNGDLARYAV